MKQHRSQQTDAPLLRAEQQASVHIGPTSDDLPQPMCVDPSPSSNSPSTFCSHANAHSFSSSQRDSFEASAVPPPFAGPSVVSTPGLMLAPPTSQQPAYPAFTQPQRAGSSPSSTAPNSTCFMAGVYRKRLTESSVDTAGLIPAVRQGCVKSALEPRQWQQYKRADGRCSLRRPLRDTRGIFCLDAVPCCPGPFTEAGLCQSGISGGVCCCKLSVPLQRRARV